eukprot:g3091.t1
MGALRGNGRMCRPPARFLGAPAGAMILPLTLLLGMPPWQLFTDGATEATLFPVRQAGPPSSVVDIVVVGEAYTTEADFRDDLTRMTSALWRGKGAYATFAPVSSVWGLFVASHKDAIGAQGRHADTLLRLYRDPDAPLRSILPTDGFTYEKAEALCAEHVPFKPDFIVILAHDQFYGGLGDEIAIISSSPTTGGIGFRHELGHNFADIGEEYDGGQDYSGGNFALTRRICLDGEGPRTVPIGDGVFRNVWPCISWGKWLSVPMAPGQDVVAEEKAAMLLAQWPWYKFAVGDDRPADTRVLRFFSDGNQAYDRVRIVFRPPAQLCHVMVYQLGASYHSSVGGTVGNTKTPFVGAFPVFSAPGKLEGFRPTDNMCLMRNMHSESICPVCRELMWRSLARKSHFVFGAKYTAERQNNDLTGKGLGYFLLPLLRDAGKFGLG